MHAHIRTAAKVAFIAALLGAGLQSAHAGAVIINPAGTVALGINDAGHLNFSSAVNPSNASATGLSIITPAGVRLDATAPGCLCEGWGVSGNGVAGYANVSTDGGVNNLTVDTFSSTATTATSNVHVTSLPTLSVSQVYTPATEAGASDVLYKDTVTITNTGAATITDVRYVRVMDWDVPPTEFSEYVSIVGTASTTLLQRSHNDGFETANPLVNGSPITASTLNSDFTDLGVLDHGAYFRFGFGNLAAGESKTFSIYYGAAFSETQALNALGAVGIELYSLGQSSTPNGPDLGLPYTFAFGFKGVGGIVVVPPGPESGAVPEPGTYGLIGAALLGAAVYFRRRQTKN
ncbi:MAG TPA: PEP-CTERM sorting domain-containing protein [Opitutaceae bacterium]|nr:PEP-CTERM sorting domain-containing protein [Opitutaceae bacterium]